MGITTELESAPQKREAQKAGANEGNRGRFGDGTWAGFIEGEVIEDETTIAAGAIEDQGVDIAKRRTGESGVAGAEASENDRAGGVAGEVASDRHADSRIIVESGGDIDRGESEHRTAKIDENAGVAIIEQDSGTVVGQPVVRRCDFVEVLLITKNVADGESGTDNGGIVYRVLLAFKGDGRATSQ